MVAMEKNLGTQQQGMGRNAAFKLLGYDEADIAQYEKGEKILAGTPEQQAKEAAIVERNGGNYSTRKGLHSILRLLK